MSVIAKENEKDKDESGVVTKTGTSTGSTGGGQVASGPAISRQQEGSGQAPNIQKYIQANQGAGQQIASGIQEKAQQQAETIQRGVDTSRTAFDQQAGNLQSKLGEQGQQSTQMAFKDPQALLQDQQRLDEFKRLQSQGYNQDIQASQQDLSGLQSQQQQLASAGQMAGTEEGRFGLLQQTYGQPSYSMGQQRLDQLLFQTAPNASRSLQYDIGNLAQQEGSRISEFGDKQQARLDALMGLSQDRATEIKNMLQFGTDQEGLEEDLSGRGLTDIQSDLETRLQEVQKTAPEKVAAIRERLASNTVTDEDLAALGLGGPGSQIYDLDLTKYINQNTIDPTLAGVASRDDFDRYQALRQLAGDTESDIFGGTTDVGTYNPYAFDKGAFESDLEKRQRLAEEQQGLLFSGIQNLEGSSVADILQGEYEGGIDTIEEIDRANQELANFRRTMEQNLIDRAARDLYTQRTQPTELTAGINYGPTYTGERFTPEQLNQMSYEQIKEAMASGWKAKDAQGRDISLPDAQMDAISRSRAGEAFENWLNRASSLSPFMGTNVGLTEDELKGVEGYRSARDAINELARIKYGRRLGQESNSNLETGGYFGVT